MFRTDINAFSHISNSTPSSVLYLLSSLILTCCPEFPSSSCPSSYHHLSPEQLCLHPTWSSQFHTGSIQHLTTQGTACHALTLLWWENIDRFSWLLEMGPQMLHHLGNVIFNVTAAYWNTRLAVFCIQPHWTFKLIQDDTSSTNRSFPSPNTTFSLSLLMSPSSSSVFRSILMFLSWKFWIIPYFAPVFDFWTIHMSP